MNKKEEMKLVAKRIQFEEARMKRLGIRYLTEEEALTKYRVKEEKPTAAERKAIQRGHKEFQQGKYAAWKRGKKH